MNRREKQICIDGLRKTFAESQGAFLVGVEGLTVDQVQKLRKSLHGVGGSMKVAKNRLVKLAVGDHPGLSKLTSDCKNQIAIIFAHNDVPAVAKLVVDFSKNNERMSVVAGAYEAQKIDTSMITFIATLPPREILAAQLVGTIKAPLARTVGAMQQVMSRLVYVIQAASEKQQSI